MTTSAPVEEATCALNADYPLDGITESDYPLDLKRKEIQLGRRNQVTIPKEFLDDGVTLFVCEKHEDGSIVLQPRASVPYRQHYFWSKRWQKGEAAASEDIKAGRLKRHASAKSLNKSLGLIPKR